MEFFVDVAGQQQQLPELGQAPSTSPLAEILYFSTCGVIACILIICALLYICGLKENCFLFYDFVESTQHLFISIFIIIFLIFELSLNQTSLLLPLLYVFISRWFTENRKHLCFLQSAMALIFSCQSSLTWAIINLRSEKLSFDTKYNRNVL